MKRNGKKNVNTMNIGAKSMRIRITTPVMMIGSTSKKKNNQQKKSEKKKTIHFDFGTCVYTCTYTHVHVYYFTLYLFAQNINKYLKTINVSRIYTRARVDHA